MSRSSSQRSGFRADIQGLRGLAVVLVVVFHTGVGLPGGFVGVDVFFAISGYVIAGSLVRELTASGAVDLVGFYGRRIRRLLPALALTIVVVLLAVLVLLSPFGDQGLAAKTALAATGFVANAFLYLRPGGYFAAGQDANVFLHTWSLAVEEQFYLVFPVLFLVAWRAGRSRGRCAVGAVVSTVGLLSLVACWAITIGQWPFGPTPNPSLAFYSPFTRAWEFAAGAALALVPLRHDGASSRSRVGAAGLGLVMVLGASLAFDGGTAFPGLAAALPVGGAVLMLAAGNAAGPITRLLSWRPVTWLGDLSYGWYLLHWPAIVLAGIVSHGSTTAMVAAAVGSLGGAALMFWLVEEPIRSRRRWRGRATVGIALVAVAAPVVMVALVVAASSTRLGLDPPSAWSSVGRANACFDTPGQRWPERRCTFTVTGSRGTIVVVGDSQALGAAEAAIVAGNRLGYDVAVWSRSACPFLLDRAPAGNPSCPGWQRSAVDLVHRLRPAVVVIANRSSGYTRPTVGLGPAARTISSPRGGVANSRSAALRSWSGAFRATVEDLVGRGAAVVDFEEIPSYRVDFISALSILHPHPYVERLSRATLARRRGAVLAAERSASRSERFVSFDPADALCRRVCTPVRDGAWLYRDFAHLSTAGSHRLVPTLQVALARALPTSPSR